MTTTEDIAHYSTNRENIARSYKIYSAGFKLGWTCLAIAVVSFQLKDIELIKQFVDVLSVLLLLISWLCFVVPLGILAKSLGKNWLLWAWLSTMLFPWGFLVAYYKMKKSNAEMRALLNMKSS